MTVEVSPRQVAIRSLLKSFRKNLPLERVLGQPALDHLDDRDRRFIKELVYGTLRYRLQLDYFVEQVSNRPLHRIDEEVLWILRIALYQIRFLRVPNHAAVNEAARLCRQFEKGSASGFANALLRNYLRRTPRLPAGESPADLAVRFSHPEWLVRRYLNRYGKAEALILMERNNTPPEPVVWVNPLKTEVEPFCQRLHQEGIGASRVEGLPGAVIVEGENFVQHHFYRQGYCFLMDANSQRVAELPNLNGCHRIVDLCAAPGNKSFILAVRRHPSTQLISSDANYRRLLEMRERMKPFGIRGIDLMVQSLERVPALTPSFDFVLLDVPCSGMGTIRSNPDIRWKVGEGDLLRFQTRQLTFLHNAFQILQSGGELLYSTCSTEPEENSQVVDLFLQAQPAAERCSEDQVWFSSALPGDGFYAARVRRL